jgi:hypothetical protein
MAGRSHAVSVQNSSAKKNSPATTHVISIPASNERFGVLIELNKAGAFSREHRPESSEVDLVARLSPQTRTLSLA